MGFVSQLETLQGCGSLVSLLLPSLNRHGGYEWRNARVRPLDRCDLLGKDRLRVRGRRPWSIRLHLAVVLLR